MDKEFLECIRLGIISGNILASIDDYKKSGAILDEYTPFLKLAGEFITLSNEQKRKINNYDFFDSGGFFEYGLLINACTNIEDFFYKENVKNLDDISDTLQNYLNNSINTGRLDEKGLNWLEKFFNSLNKICQGKTGHPLEKGLDASGVC